MSESVVLRGMGAIAHKNGVAFRVWAPHADAVFVTGSFNGWSDDEAPMAAEGDGIWYADVAGAKPGDEYRFLIRNGEKVLSRIDPYAREVTSSVGNGIVVEPDEDWHDVDFQTPPWNELVIYEMHIGTFHRPSEEQPGTFEDAGEKLAHLKRLGVNAVQIMPAMEFAGDVSWGYNPAHIYAVESAYGGPDDFKAFIKMAHRHGIAVILDVVYNHFGPSDLDLWQFDGWSEDDKGGIYFYNDWRSETPWGETRPDYDRGEVRQFIRDNALFWLGEYHLDGLRFDMTLYIRNVRGDEADEGDALPEGWSLLQWINGEVRERFPGRITMAEDLRNKAEITAAVEQGGAGFGAQWDSEFVHPIRQVLITGDDEARHMATVAHALQHSYNGDPFQRVVYTESHDEVANGRARVPHEIAPDDFSHWAAQKRSTLGAALMFTAPGIPMLFQGQEFLQGEWFQDTVPLEWDQSDEFSGIVRLYHDLIRLRLNRSDATRGLLGRDITIPRVDEEQKLLTFHRSVEGGPGDDVIVVANFSHAPREAYCIGFPRQGVWKLRLNTDWVGYSPDFGNFSSQDAVAEPGECDGMAWSGEIAVGPYSALIFSQDD
ncbi:alpha-amylase family glycosyl hydrolase [Chelativorans sp. M5D2P16]|uniref:alpha-amylase family glycosyl hydrolase n=1 Tax=Chelativorans sp. M5D2P16 TaxID=3095678 RepID=UPI002ACA0210|nr:alpha-amylase family glycosyl hydrolase [Chelativorans sp. M5D2P16]MDZ5696750.1 alpha-amylase family glycosyl hydrolase [Chelativorans sp. M5D2P16]